jgi:hypothetical protein
MAYIRLTNELYQTKKTICIKFTTQDIRWPNSAFNKGPSVFLLKWKISSIQFFATQTIIVNIKKHKNQVNIMYVFSCTEYLTVLSKSHHPMHWRDSISRLIAQVSSVAGGDEATSPRRQGIIRPFYYLFSYSSGRKCKKLGCQMVNFQTKNSYVGKFWRKIFWVNFGGKSWRILWPFWIFYSRFGQFMGTWQLSFNLVYFPLFWYIVTWKIWQPW